MREEFGGLPTRPATEKQRTSAARRPAVSVSNYRDDPLYPRICRVVAALLQRGKLVAPVDVLVGLGLLAPQDLENWRRGRVPYLERVINCNLTRLSRLLRILRFHAHDLKLMPSWTAYMCWSKGPKQRLRFTKTGDSKLEKAYATHLVWPGKGPFHPPVPKHEQSRPSADKDKRSAPIELPNHRAGRS